MILYVLKNKVKKDGYIRWLKRWLYFFLAIDFIDVEVCHCLWIVTKVRVDRNKSACGS